MLLGELHKQQPENDDMMVVVVLQSGVCIFRKRGRLQTGNQWAGQHISLGIVVEVVNKLLGHLGILLGLDLLVLGSLRPLQSWSVGGGIVVVAQLGTGCDRVIQMGDISQSQAQKLQQNNPHTGQLKVGFIIIAPLQIFTDTCFNTHLGRHFTFFTSNLPF